MITVISTLSDSSGYSMYQFTKESYSELCLLISQRRLLFFIVSFCIIQTTSNLLILTKFAANVKIWTLKVIFYCLMDSEFVENHKSSFRANRDVLETFCVPKRFPRSYNSLSATHHSAC